MSSPRQARKPAWKAADWPLPRPGGRACHSHAAEPRAGGHGVGEALARRIRRAVVTMTASKESPEPARALAIWSTRGATFSSSLWAGGHDGEVQGRLWGAQIRHWATVRCGTGFQPVERHVATEADRVLDSRYDQRR